MGRRTASPARSRTRRRSRVQCVLRGTNRVLPKHRLLAVGSLVLRLSHDGCSSMRLAATELDRRADVGDLESTIDGLWIRQSTAKPKAEAAFRVPFRGMGKRDDEH